jgi:hydrogenase maturation protease
VRLDPKARGDIFDSALKGKLATIVAIEQDFEGRAHFAVTLTDDPGSDLGAAGFPGHRFYFSRDEMALVNDGGRQ